MSLHTDQVASVIQRAVQAVLTRGLNDPRVRGLVSVTRVNVSPDLSQARVFISVTPAEHEELAMHGLRHAASHIRHAISSTVSLRRLPRLTFHLDESLKKEAAVLAALNRVRREDEELNARRADPAESEDPRP
ncbi:MAG: 30S ribosome-binding factor RbfA [Phycisphaerales bacterium]|nr:MAG: 30S ribosome-binding factor RbfA [Phycisphaerales bacterium]